MKKYIDTERPNLFEPNSTIAMKFSILGEVSYQNIIKAFDLAVKSNEILNSKIVLSKDGTAWYEPCEEQHNHITIMQSNWQDVLAEQKNKLFQIDKGEFLKGFFFPSKSKSDVLILANHLAGDGKSIVYFIEQMMKSLNNEALLLKKIQKISLADIPEKEKIPIFINYFITYYNRRWEKDKTYFSMEDRYKIHNIYWNRTDIRLFNEHFSSEELNRLITKTKIAQVSLTSYLISTFCSHMKGNISIGLAIDARLDENRNMGNQTSGTTIHYKFKSKQSIIKNAHYIQKKLKKKLANIYLKYFVLYFLGKLNGTLIDSIYMYLSDSYKNPTSQKIAKICKYNEYSCNLSISNLTQLDIPNHYGDYEIKDFIFIPPYISYGKRLIGIATLGNEMNITFQIKENEYTKLELEQFKKVMEALKK